MGRIRDRDRDRDRERLGEVVLDAVQWWEESLLKRCGRVYWPLVQ